MSPTERTKAYLKRQGYLCGTVERFIQPGGRGGYRRDLFGIIDLICIRKDEILGVQSTGQDYSGHFRKITEEKPLAARAWLESGGKLQLIAWRKLKAGWQPRIYQFTEKDFPQSGLVLVTDD